MKQVYITKDAYQNNSLRVNYFEKDCIQTVTEIEWNEETQEIKEKTIQNIYDNLLFCERLFWEIDEIELDQKIEETRLIWEGKINN